MAENLTKLMKVINKNLQGALQIWSKTTKTMGTKRQGNGFFIMQKENICHPKNLCQVKILFKYKY